MVRLLFTYFILALFLGACGIENSLPIGGAATPIDIQTGDQIVNVSKTNYTYEGVQVTCNINEVLVSPDIPVHVFIEFENLEIERKAQTNSTKYAFSSFKPKKNGYLRCVVLYGGSEFESSQKFISTDEIITNGAAHLLFSADGSVRTWGGQISGGDSTNSTGIATAAGYLPDSNSNGVSDHLESGVAKIVGIHSTPEYGPTNSFAALKFNGSVVAWGYNLHGGDPTGFTSPPANIKTLPDLNNDFIADALSGDVVDVFFSIFSFAALKSNGSIITWGDSGRGGDATGTTSPATNIKTLADANTDGVADVLASGVQTVSGSVYAYAALKSDGSVVSWGDGDYGGDATGTTTATNHSLADLNADGVADLLESGVVEVFGGRYSFSALKNDGSVVSWGHRRYGGDQTQASGDSQTMPLPDLNTNGVADLLESQVVKIYATYRAYCALKSDGSIVAWGEDNEGGDPTHFMGNSGYGYLPDLNNNYVADLLESNVIDVQRTRGAFAALKSDGSVVAWGRASRGGDPTDLTGLSATVKSLSDLNSDFIADEISSGVKSIFSNMDAFAALKNDGSVIVWGNTQRGGDPVDSAAVGNVGSLPDANANGEADLLESGILKVFTSEHAMAALRSDGSVVAWGTADKGGDPTCAQSPANTHCLADLDANSIADVLESGVINVIPMSYPGFIAIKSDGQIVTWGNTDYGGDIYNDIGRSDIGYLSDLNANLIPDILEP